MPPQKYGRPDLTTVAKVNGCMLRTDSTRSGIGDCGGGCSLVPTYCVAGELFAAKRVVALHRGYVVPVIKARHTQKVT